MRKALLAAVFALLGCGGSDSGGGASAQPAPPKFQSGTYTVSLNNPGGVGTMCSDPATAITVDANGAVTGVMHLSSCAWTDAAGAPHTTAPLTGNLTGNAANGNAVQLSLGTALSIGGATEAWGFMGIATPAKEFATFGQVKLYATRQ